MHHTHHTCIHHTHVSISHTHTYMLNMHKPHTWIHHTHSDHTDKYTAYVPTHRYTLHTYTPIHPVCIYYHTILLFLLSISLSLSLLSMCMLTHNFLKPNSIIHLMIKKSQINVWEIQKASFFWEINVSKSELKLFEKYYGKNMLPVIFQTWLEYWTPLIIS